MCIRNVYSGGGGRGENKKSPLGVCPPHMGFGGGGCLPQGRTSGGPGGIIGGAKITAKIASYLMLKGQEFFNDPLKTCFLDDSRGVSGKFFKIQNFWPKLNVVAFVGYFFFENLPKMV